MLLYAGLSPEPSPPPIDAEVLFSVHSGDEMSSKARRMVRARKACASAHAAHSAQRRCLQCRLRQN
jgi:hypothetical protein